MSTYDELIKEAEFIKEIELGCGPPSLPVGLTDQMEPFVKDYLKCVHAGDVCPGCVAKFMHSLLRVACLDVGHRDRRAYIMELFYQVESVSEKPEPTIQ